MSSGWAIRQADYRTDEPTIRQIRFAVFVDEQAVPPEIEMDDRDPVSTHFLALAAGGAVGTARIDLGLGGKVGRLAVLPPWRRHGIGRALMQRCHDTAAANGLSAVWCHAQVTAVSFYSSLGYRTAGGVFEEAGIDHQRMVLGLSSAGAGDR